MTLKTIIADLADRFFVPVLCFFGGKKIKENEILHKENEKLQKQVKLAARPDVAWDKLLEWLRSQ